VSPTAQPMQPNSDRWPNPNVMADRWPNPEVMADRWPNPEIVA